MKRKKHRPTDAEIERLLELMSIMSMTPERAEQDVRDVIRLGIMTEAELDAAAEASWARVKELLRPTIAKCLGTVLAEHSLTESDLSIDLGAPREAVQQLLVSQERLDRDLVRGVALKLASLHHADYGRLVHWLSRGLTIVEEQSLHGSIWPRPKLVKDDTRTGN